MNETNYYSHSSLQSSSVISHLSLPILFSTTFTQTRTTTMEMKQGALAGDMKLQLAVAALIGVFGIAVVTAGPSLSAVAAFFGPLVVSTVFLLAAVAVLFRISPPPAKGDAADDQEMLPGQELMQYVVAGNPVEVLSCDGINLNLDRVLREEGQGETVTLTTPEKEC